MTSSHLLPDIKQGTEAWLEWRATRYTASDAQVIMGTAPNWRPVRTWDELRIERAGIKVKANDFLERAADRGHDKEVEARDHLTVDHPPASVENGLYGASLDGLGIDPDGRTRWLEIKAPMHGRHSKAWQHVEDHAGEGAIRQIPDHYYWQLVHQAAVIDDPDAVCWFVLWIDKENYIVLPCEASDLLKDWPKLKLQWELFAEGEQPGRSDDQWSEAVFAWRAAKRGVEIANRELDQARATLMYLADGENAQGCGISLKMTMRKGNVNWRAFAASLYSGPADIGEAADNYRNPDTESTTIRDLEAEPKEKK